MKENSDNSFLRIANFFFEAGMLGHMQRSGIRHLGSGEQSVASHVFRTSVIGYTLAVKSGADASKVMMMCMFHDIEETRTGDLNYLEQRYVKSDDERALRDVLAGLPIEDEVQALLKEYAEQSTEEAVLAKDADNLELITFLKEELDKGNAQAENWMRAALKRLKTDIAVKTAEAVLETMYYEWWYNLDEHWKDGSKKW